MTTKLNSKKKSKSSRKGWTILLISLTILCASCFTWYWFNKALFSVYYYDMVVNPFKPGNKVYLREYYVDKSSAKDRFNVSLYRLAIPLSDDDVDQMSISLADKALIKKDLSSKKPYMTECGWAINTEVLSKLKSAFICNYTESKISDEYFDGKYFPMIFIAVHPLRKSLFRESLTEAPSGYKFDDNFPFYLAITSISTSESRSFR